MLRLELGLNPTTALLLLRRWWAAGRVGLFARGTLGELSSASTEYCCLSATESEGTASLTRLPCPLAPIVQAGGGFIVFILFLNGQALVCYLKTVDETECDSQMNCINSSNRLKERRWRAKGREEEQTKRQRSGKGLRRRVERRVSGDFEAHLYQESIMAIIR